MFLFGFLPISWLSVSELVSCDEHGRIHLSGVGTKDRPDWIAQVGR